MSRIVMSADEAHALFLRRFSDRASSMLVTQAELAVRAARQHVRGAGAQGRDLEPYYRRFLFESAIRDSAIPGVDVAEEMDTNQSTTHVVLRSRSVQVVSMTRSERTPGVTPAKYRDAMLATCGDLFEVTRSRPSSADTLVVWFIYGAPLGEGTLQHADILFPTQDAMSAIPRLNLLAWHRGRQVAAQPSAASARHRLRLRRTKRNNQE